ncbi:MAG: hypothetical protein ACYSU0_22800 [Planctomycetota bacterium]|jgi:hypothetical protein
MLRFVIVLVPVLVGVAGCAGCQEKESGSRVPGAVGDHPMAAEKARDGPSAGANAPDAREKTEVDKLLDSRPTPDLTNLAERSAVGRRGKDAGEAFWDVLKLRETGTEEAVPVLERILAGHANSTRIHGYAAAQALFDIDTPQAHSILSRHLLSPGYNARHGIRYIFGWDMDESKRDAFIERYHLRHLSKDMKLTLSATSQPGQHGQCVLFSVVARNISEKAFRIPDRKYYLGDLLFFRSMDGRFVRRERTIEIHLRPSKYLELAPGASHRYDVAVDVRHVDDIGELRGWYEWLSKDASLVLTTGGVAYDVGRPGHYEVRAMLELPEPTEAQARFAGFDDLWSGRAVSPPVKVNVLTPSPRRTKPKP